MGKDVLQEFGSSAHSDRSNRHSPTLEATMSRQDWVNWCNATEKAAKQLRELMWDARNMYDSRASAALMALGPLAALDRLRRQIKE
jgi:hypothetical protein